MAEIFDPNAVAPDFSAQSATVARQRKLADYLRTQADREQAPQGEMVGGQFIAPHWSQQLNKPLQQITAGYMGRQADAAEQGALDQQAAHAQQWRANMPQEVEGREAIPENYVMQSPEDQAGVPGVQAQPMTLDRVLKHTLAAGGNPALTRDAELFSKYSVANIESKQKQREARELKEATIASQEKLAREKLEAEEKYRRTEAQRQAEFQATLTSQENRAAARQAASDRRLSQTLGALGVGSIQKIDMVDGSGREMFHTKDGNTFVYNEQGQAVPPAPGVKPKLNAAGEKAVLDARADLATIGNARQLAKLAPPGTFGVKNMPPFAEDVRQRTHPGGVAARAAVTNVGSQKLHDRSGAAVTISEFPRLKPFIPSVNDTPEAIDSKLEAMEREYASIQREWQTNPNAPNNGGPVRPGLGMAQQRPATPALPPGWSVKTR